MTHDQLVQRAKRWLRGTGGCRIVVTEFVAGEVGEIPDAMGWGHRGQSILIECKTSRSDFFADKNKTFRRVPENGMGMRRYYMFPSGLVEKTEVDERWGMLSVGAKKVTRVREAPWTDLGSFGQRRERELLISVAWRALEALNLVRPINMGAEDETCTQ